uniref:Uncharacterized protein n=1 Tax=Rhizophora mucronata TaxID=61149 RepID=A0A2P2LVB7_RHIMU
MYHPLLVLSFNLRFLRWKSKKGVLINRSSINLSYVYT